MRPPYRMPNGKYKCKASPTIRPIDAPILNTGMNIPLGTGIVEPIIEKTNWKNRIILLANFFFNVKDGNIYRKKHISGEMEENICVLSAPMIHNSCLFYS